MASPNSTKIQKEMNQEIPAEKFSHPWKVFSFEAIFFLLTIFLGILVALKIMKYRKSHQIPPAEPVSPPHFLFAFALATAFLLLVPLFFKKRRWRASIFKVIFLLPVFFGGILTLGLWLGDSAIILMAILIFCWLKFPSPFFHNLSLILAMAGLGATLALSLTPLMVVAFLILFSIYDFIAVYKTKHMIKIAKETAEGGVILGFVAPQKFSDLVTSLREIKIGGKFLILGSGDVISPLLLVVSLLPQNIFNAFLVAIFSFLGLFVSFFIFISQKIRSPMPALPPIALFSLFGYLLTLLI